VKILLDPVYTALPSSCSTSYLFWQIIEELIAARDDVFFHLLVPQSALENDDEKDFLLRHQDRVRLVPYDGGCRDRMREMWTFPTEFADILHPASVGFFDVDAVISSRIHQLAMFKFNSARRQSYGNGSFRTFIGMEEMPIFSFSKTVAWHEEDHFIDLYTLGNYNAADAVVLSSFWARARVLQAARANLTPSKVRQLSEKLYEGAPVPLERLEVKEPAGRPEKLNVVFCGRAVSSANFADVAEMFRTQFSFPLGKGDMDFIVSTNSAGVTTKQYGDMSMVSIEQNGREAFYKFLRETAHVAINPSPVNDFSLSTYEMLKHGVPVIVYDKDWTNFLGRDYPFRAASFEQAYGFVNLFAQEYETAMAMFADWEATYWADFVEEQEGKQTPIVARDLVLAHEKNAREWLAAQGFGQTYLELIEKVKAQGEPFVNIDKMLKDEEMMHPSGLTHKNVVGRTPIFQIVKLLMLNNGYKDTLEPGVVALREDAA